MMTKNKSETAVAEWMLAALDEDDILYQEQAVYDIQEKFGDAFVYENNSGNLAISKDVLAAFLKITGDDVVWSRSERMWRRREDTDEPGRQQP